MLTIEQMNQNELEYFRLLSMLNVDLTNFNKFLEEVDFFHKPASISYGGSYPGGLCEYAIKFATNLGIMCDYYYPGRYTKAEILKVALLKDIYRAVMYESYQKNVKNEQTGQWTTVNAYKTKDGNARPVYGDIGLSSFMLAKNFFDFTDEQIEAIIHAAPFETEVDIHDVMRQYPLVALTKMAGMGTTYLN